MVVLQQQGWRAQLKELLSEGSYLMNPDPAVSLRGQTPAESDFQVLEIARKLEMYGVRLHLAADREGTRISLAVAHLGLQVFQVTHTSSNVSNTHAINL